MEENLAKLRERYPWVRLWMPVAALVAVLILGYSAWLGLRYLDASARVDSLERKLSDISAQATNLDIRDDQLAEDPDCDKRVLENPSLAETLTQDLCRQKRRLAEVTRNFSHAQPDQLMTIVSDVAKANNVGVEAMSVGKMTPALVEEEATYLVMPMSMRLEGDPADMYRFLARLNERIPEGAVTDIRLGNLDRGRGSPVAEVRILIYLAPGPLEPVPAPE